MSCSRVPTLRVLLGVWRGGKGIALGGVEESEINI